MTTEVEIKIEKGIPIPRRNKPAGKRYPFNALEIGDSMFLPNLKSSDLSGFFSYHRPNKFSARTRIENDVAGVRVWRVS